MTANLACLDETGDVDEVLMHAALATERLRPPKLHGVAKQYPGLYFSYMTVHRSNRSGPRCAQR